MAKKYRSTESEIETPEVFSTETEVTPEDTTVEEPKIEEEVVEEVPEPIVEEPKEEVPEVKEEELKIEEEVVVETPTEEVKEDDYKTINQNFVLLAKNKLNLVKESNKRLAEIQNKTVAEVNAELALSKETRALTPAEEELRMKRDYYKLSGNEGKNLPKETDLQMFKSPQATINLALDQVKMLIGGGYKLTNLRTGDVIKPRNVDEYIVKWNKNGSTPILK